MSSAYSTDLSIYIADQFRNSLSTSNVYLTFGYVSAWENELNPPQANTSTDSINETWKYMLGGKRVVASDVRHVVPRHDWAAGTVYTPYDNTVDSWALKGSGSAMYVMTDDFNVFKCISNNYGGPSLYKPSSTNPASQFQTADLYIWKFMYSLTREEQLRFLTADYMPVKTLLGNDNSLQWQVQYDSVPGAIHDVIITNPGIAYTQNNISVTITGDGRFANAYAVRDYSNNVIKDIIIDNKGSGYTYANVAITSSRGNNALARAIISPTGGHGSDALHELGGTYLLINTTLDGSEGGVLVTQNDYRQISLISNPTIFNDSNVMSNLVFSQVTALTLAASTVTLNYIQDEIVYQGTDLANATFKALVASWDSANSLLKVTNTQGNPTATLITGTQSTAERYVSSVVFPDCQPYSGYLLYKDNITKIIRSEDQNEDFKIVLSF
jgi:Bacteriophage T4, Gp8